MERLTRLDGLRAVAVLLVIQEHWGNLLFNRYLLPGGWGVNGFFALSGFLITGILLRIREFGTPCQSLLTFYARRALRIFPAYYLVLLVGALLTREVRDNWMWHAGYLSNVKMVLDDRWPALTSHFWSLAVEEQFYIVWPALILFTPRHHLERVILWVVALAPAWRLVMHVVTGGNQFAAGQLLMGASDGLGIGAWLACRAERDADPLDSRFVSAGLVLFGCVQVATALDTAWPLLVMAPGTAWALVFVWVIDHARRNGRGTAWLEWRPLVYIGTVSYGVYLIHNFVASITMHASPALAAWMRTRGSAPAVAVAALSIAFASASWFAFERPLNELKRHLPYRRTPGRGVTNAAYPGDSTLVVG